MPSRQELLKLPTNELIPKYREGQKGLDNLLRSSLSELENEGMESITLAIDNISFLDEELTTNNSTTDSVFRNKSGLRLNTFDSSR